MVKDSIYYEMLTTEQKRTVIDAAKLLPYMSIGRVAKIFVECGENEAAFKRHLFTNYAIKYGGDRI